MRNGQLAAVVRRLEHAGEPGWTDGDLLESFLAHRDDSSFEALVRRHGGMVMGVCRRLLPHRQDAEDAFQLTFLVLARRASDVQPREQVGAWLHGVAYRTAMGHRRSLLRVRAKEKPLEGIPYPAARPERHGEELLLAIDRELDRLPEKLRLPVVLCDLEGHSLREAARRLGVPDATLSNRLRLARRRLAARLREHGVTPETALAPLLGGASLAPELIAAACSASRPSLFLALGAWKTMRLIPLAALVMLAGAGGAWLVPGGRSRPGGEAQAAPPPKFSDHGRRERILKTLAEAVEELRASAGAKGDRRTLPHRLLLDMAGFEMKLGRREAAWKLFKEADELISAMKDDFRFHEMRMLARALAEAGEKDEAVAVALRVPAENQYRDVSLQEAAERLAGLRREKDALEVVSLVKDPKDRSWLRQMVLQEAALAHARGGDMTEAFRVVERMDPATKVTTLAGVVYGNRWFRDCLDVPGIAVIQAEAGDSAAARKSLRLATGHIAAITDKEQQDRALTSLACARARLGDLGEARKLAEAIRGKNGKVFVLAALAGGLVKAGQVKAALAEAAKQADADDKAHVLIHVGAARAKAKDTKGAVETFAEAHAILEADQKAREEAYDLVRARAMAGDDEGAMKSVEAFLSHNLEYGRGHCVQARAQRGDFAGALSLAEKQTEVTSGQGDLLWAIAREQTRAGQEKAARVWISRLESPFQRAYALFGVAEGIMKGR